MKCYNPILQHIMSKHGVRCIPDNMLYTSVNKNNEIKDSNDNISILSCYRVSFSHTCILLTVCIYTGAAVHQRSRPTAGVLH